MEDVKLTNGYHNGHADIMSYKNDMNKTKINNIHYMNGTDSKEKSDDGKEEFLNGPDQIIPTDEYTSTLPNGRVKLRLSDKGINAEPPISVPSMLERTVARLPDTIALASKTPEGVWVKTTYREYQQMVLTCAKAFLKLGLERHHSVAILGFNSPEWFIADLAAIHAGGIAVGIYTTNTAEACHYVLENSQANIVVVEDDKQMNKIRAVWSRLPNLKAAIQWEGQPKDPLDNMYSWKQVMDMGRSESDIKLKEALKRIAINECCTLVYTSGTVGQPKGTMLTHDNLVWEAFAISKRANFIPGSERVVSFLPLSHVAAQMVDIHMAIISAITIYFADKNALKGSLVQTLQEAQPTLFVAVPRVWEKMYEKMMAIAETNGMIKKAIAGWAKQQGLNHHMSRLVGSNYESYSFKLAKALVLKRVQTALGLSQARLCVSAAAPLSTDVKKYFLSLDIPIMDVYGMSEISSAQTLSVLDLFRMESAGMPLEGAETKFDNIDPVNGDGEVCMRGRHIFMGYLNDPKKTEEALDKDGWIHSGDLGKTDEDGFLYITGRIKELLITAGGENIAPVLIEQQLKSELPIVSQAMLVGDKKKFLCVLLTLKTEINGETGMPTDTLTSDVVLWLENLGCSAKTVTELLNSKDEKVWEKIDEGIERANEHAISNAQKIQKFNILPVDFSIATGELGPTMKLKRSFVIEKYDEIIEKLYEV